METVSNMIRIACKVAGLAGILLCGYALVDPSILPDTGGDGPWDTVDPRWRAVLGLAMSVLVFGYGLRPQAHRQMPADDEDALQ